MKVFRKVLSLFDGMSCGRVALERAGVHVEEYYASEIDPYAEAISKKNYPDIIRLGDVTNWRWWDIDWASIDLILAGNPCQSFSNAGNGNAFEDDRGGLFFTMIDIIEHTKKYNKDVKWLVENVKMKKQFLDVFSEHLGVEPVFINSSLVSALNRPRYYWSNAIWQERKQSADMVECTDCEEPFCVKHNKHFSDCLCVGIHEEDNLVENREGLVFRLPEDLGLTIKDVLSLAADDMPWLSQKAVERLKGINKRAKVNNLGYKDCILSDNQKYLNLDASYYKGCDGKRGVIVQDGRLRMLTPEEAEKMQTLPEGYTVGVSNTQRYKMIGNGWTIDVIVHLLKNIA